MGWHMDSGVGAAIWDTTSLSREDILCRDEELAWLQDREERRWSLINGRIQRSGHPTALNSPYGGDPVDPPVQDQTPATGVSTVLGWWDSKVFTPFPLNAVRAGQLLRLKATGKITSSATAQTMTMNPGIGATAVNAAPGSNVTLGASGAISLGASSAQTGMFWILEGTYTVRAGGQPGSVLGVFKIEITNVAGASSSVVATIFGTTLASVDFTVTPTGGASGQTAVIAGTANATAVSVTTQQVHWSSWN